MLVDRIAKVLCRLTLIIVAELVPHFAGFANTGIQMVFSNVVDNTTRSATESLFRRLVTKKNLI
jgi:hypothetical protein